MAAATRNTKRPLNKCKSCGKTWYPRGSNLSSRCPRCGSSKTKVAGLGILGTIALLAILGGHPNKPAPDQSPAVDTSPAAIATNPAVQAFSSDAIATDAAWRNLSGTRTEPQDSADDAAISGRVEVRGSNDTSPTGADSRQEPQNRLQSLPAQGNLDVFNHH
ncbi:hypothetical protein BC1002_3701 [Paraburkholderia atlantica]|uniref:Uncharacterized protein n=1 Tax=Paraburkholderia atlantica TaxID=2654982 RepID=D5WGX8_PARAM|nr:hypothetical protein BC1002_3701 [Paraburkholderia atlantica]